MELDIRDELSEKHGGPLGDMLQIPLSKGDPSRIVQISLDLDKVKKERLTAFLQENADVFTWFAADMLEMDSNVNINLTYCSMK